MGERLNDGTGHGRRRARPDDALAAPPGLEELLARALRAPAVRPRKGDDGDAGGEEADGVEVSAGERRAVAAFRAARDARHVRAGRVRPRRRDDWRPRARRHTARSLRVTLCALIAGITLGGAAFAAIDSGTDDGEVIGVGVGAVRGGEGRPRQSAGAAADSSGALSAVPSATDGADRDRPAKGGSDEDAAARCRAYEKAHGRGDGLDPADWRRLLAAAGGEKNVEAYCAAPGRRAPAAKGGPAGEAGRTGAAGGSAGAGGSDPTGTPGGAGQTGGGTGGAGGTGTSGGAGKSGGATGGTGKSGGSGEAAAGPDGTERSVPRARPGEVTTARR